MLAASIPMSPPDVSFHSKALESRIEAAAEALLRVRDEVISALDRQVGEIKQLHRVLANPPPPMVIIQDTPVMIPLPPPSPAALSVEERVALFEQPPAFVPAPTGTLRSIIQATSAVIEQTTPAHVSLMPGSPVAEPPAVAVSFPTGIHQVASVQSFAAEISPSPLLAESSPSETNLDPFLERATLEELNDALASAFAMVSSRSAR